MQKGVRNHASLARERMLDRNGDTIVGFLCTCGKSGEVPSPPSQLIDSVARPISLEVDTEGLERDGLVSRSVDKEDRRSSFAALTRAGHRRLNESRPTHNEVVRTHLTRRLSDTQLATLGAAWETILES